jgi:hypothetical protein
MDGCVMVQRELEFLDGWLNGSRDCQGSVRILIQDWIRVPLLCFREVGDGDVEAVAKVDGCGGVAHNAVNLFMRLSVFGRGGLGWM